jgi:hypothetical protein
MVTNFDVIIKKYPDVVRECLERRRCNLKVTSDGSIKSCSDGTICNATDCIFSTNISYEPYSDGKFLTSCHERIAHWLSRSASITDIDDSDMRNKDGDITW